MTDEPSRVSEAVLNDLGATDATGLMMAVFDEH